MRSFLSIVVVSLIRLDLATGRSKGICPPMPMLSIKEQNRSAPICSASQQNQMLSELLMALVMFISPFGFSSRVIGSQGQASVEGVHWLSTISFS